VTSGQSRIILLQRLFLNKCEMEVVTDESSSRGLLQTMMGAFASLSTADSDDDDE
jgi:hypothetical protein